MTHPHYLRFVRTLAIVSSIGGAGCGMASTPTSDGGSDAATTPDASADAGSDAPLVVADAGSDAASADDAGVFDCSTCSCGSTAIDAGLPSCEPDHTFPCCAAVGPLSPPDLAV